MDLGQVAQHVAALLAASGDRAQHLLHELAPDLAVGPAADPLPDEGELQATLASIRITPSPPSCNIPKFGGFSLASLPLRPSPYKRCPRRGQPFLLRASGGSYFQPP